MSTIRLLLLSRPIGLRALCCGPRRGSDALGLRLSLLAALVACLARLQPRALDGHATRLLLRCLGRRPRLFPST